MCKYGEVEEVKVCDNIGDHLLGNVYVMFVSEEDAGNAVDALNKRFYAGKILRVIILAVDPSLTQSLLIPGRPVYAELSPVTDFGEACCRQYENSECNRGGLCNFMHLKTVSRALSRELYEAQRLSLKILKGGSGGSGGSRELLDRDRDYRVLDRNWDRERDSITQHQYLNVDEDGDIFGETEADSMEMGRLNLQHEKIRLLQEIQDALSYEDAANHLKLVRFSRIHRVAIYA
ncbi:hypothetical protein HDU82_009171 [Entophlyctis luteolus]|nr:hypothetical protein HDU82_009171 [Entophlyctis luteolus]